MKPYHQFLLLLLLAVELPSKARDEAGGGFRSDSRLGRSATDLTSSEITKPTSLGEAHLNTCYHLLQYSREDLLTGEQPAGEALSLASAWLALTALSDDFSLHSAAHQRDLLHRQEDMRPKDAPPSVGRLALSCAQHLVGVASDPVAADQATLQSRQSGIAAALTLALGITHTHTDSSQQSASAKQCPPKFLLHCPPPVPVPYASAIRCVHFLLLLASPTAAAGAGALQDNQVTTCLAAATTEALKRVATRLAVLASLASGALHPPSPPQHPKGQQSVKPDLSGQTQHTEQHIHGQQQSCWVVVGAGPVGLASALQWVGVTAALQRAAAPPSTPSGLKQGGGRNSSKHRAVTNQPRQCLHLAEPRTTYTRDTWFDLASAPWYTSALWLWQLRPDTSSAMQGGIRQGHPPHTQAAFEHWWTHDSNGTATQAHQQAASTMSQEALRRAAVSRGPLKALEGALSLPPTVSASTATEHLTVQCRALEVWLAALVAILSQPSDTTPLTLDSPSDPDRDHAHHEPLTVVHRWYGWQFLFLCPSPVPMTSTPHPSKRGVQGGDAQALLVRSQWLQQVVPLKRDARKQRLRKLAWICGSNAPPLDPVCAELCSPDDKGGGAVALAKWMMADSQGFKMERSTHQDSVHALRRLSVHGLIVADGAKSMASLAAGITRSAVSLAEAASHIQRTAHTAARGESAALQEQ